MLTIRITKTSGKKFQVAPEYEEGIYLYSGEIRKLGLKEDGLIPEEEFERIRLEYAVPRAKKRAMGILAKRDKTEQELRDKLKESFHDAQSVEAAIDYVKSFGYVDDLRYAREYIYYKKGRKSFFQIRGELRRKGIPSQILDLVFEEEGKQEKEDLRPLIIKYARKFSAFDAAAKQKTYAHFYRKGYGGEDIREILEQIDLPEKLL